MSKELGKRLKLAREEAGLSKSQVAKMLNVNYRTIYAMETGDKKISDNVLTHLSKIYDVSNDWLVFGVGEQQQHIVKIDVTQPDQNTSNELNDLRAMLDRVRQNDKDGLK